MGRHYTSLGGVVPVESETNMAAAEQLFYKAAIQVAAQLFDKGLPGRRKLKPLVVIENITIMTLLPMLALFAKERPEKREIRHIRQQRLKPLLSQ